MLSYCRAQMMQQSSQCRGRYNKNKKFPNSLINGTFPHLLSVPPYLTCSRDPSTLSASSRGLKEGVEEV